MSQERLDRLEARYKELLTMPPQEPWSANYDYALWFCKAKAKLEEEIVGARHSIKPAAPVEHGKFITMEPRKKKVQTREYMAQKKRESRARAGCKDCGQPTMPKRIRCEACQDIEEVRIRERKNAAARFRRRGYEVAS